MAQPVRFYFDLLSQQCRALYMFLEACKIPYEPIQVSVLKGEQLSTEFGQKVNRLRSIPVIEDHGFRLSQTVAIFRHLAREKIVPDHWYPRRTLARSRIDECLDWQNNQLRVPCTDYFQTKWIHPAISCGQPSKSKIEAVTENLDRSLNEFQDLWIRPNEFLVGNNISFADLLAICEIDQPRMVGYNPFANRAKLQNWYNLVKDTLDHYYDDVNHITISKLLQQREGEPISMKA